MNSATVAKVVANQTTDVDDVEEVDVEDVDTEENEDDEDNALRARARQCLARSIEWMYATAYPNEIEN